MPQDAAREIEHRRDKTTLPGARRFSSAAAGAPGRFGREYRAAVTRFEDVAGADGGGRTPPIAPGLVATDRNGGTP